MSSTYSEGDKVEGWIKLYRKLLEWEWLSNPNHLVVLIHLLLRANFRVTTWRGETINPGQLLTGRKQLSLWTSLSEMQIRTVLKDLKKSKEIEIRSTKNYSIITILNWDLYQCDIQEITNEQPSDNQQATNRQPHPKNAKNVKNAKKEKNILKNSPLSTLFPESDEIQSWLLTGTRAAQEELISAHSHHVLAEEVKKAYLWQLEKKPRKAGSFLVTWMSNKKTQAFGANLAQKSKTPITPSNPTGNPYRQQRIENGEVSA